MTKPDISSFRSLPEPLSADTEAELVKNFQDNNDIDAKSKLIEHNLRLVMYIAKRFEGNKLDIQDLVSVGSIGLIKAVDSYKLDKNIKLATYASRCIENEILMYLRRSSKIKGEVSIDEPLNVDWEGNELLLSDILGTETDVTYKSIEEEVDRNLLSIAMEKLSLREKSIVDLRYGIGGSGEEKTQKEVADFICCSPLVYSRYERAEREPDIELDLGALEQDFISFLIDFLITR